MKTDNACPIKPDIPPSQANRFMLRMSACKGTLDGHETRMAPGVPQPGSVRSVTDVRAAHGKNASVHRRPEPDATAANASAESFLDLYMQAFAAARQ